MNVNRAIFAKRIIKEILEWTFTIVFAVAIALIIRSNVFAMVVVQHSSMENTLFEGQRLFENRLIYNFSQPQRGDIIILKKDTDSKNLANKIISEAVQMYESMTGTGEDDENTLVKRVIGVPGDKIEMRDGYVYINGEKKAETYAKGKTYAEAIKSPILVTEGKVFVLGDNRENSLDSRGLGLIDYSQIEGKVFYRAWPINKIGTIK